MNNKFAIPKEKYIEEQLPKTMIEAMNPEILEQMGGAPMLMNELMIWNEFHSKKFLEKSDRKEMEGIIKRAGKLFIVSLLVGGIANRILTQIKIGGKDFINMRLLFRLPIRLLIFFAAINGIFLIPMTDHLNMLSNKLNAKYVPRYLAFEKSGGDPVIMNPSYLNEEGMSEEEKEYVNKYYDSMKPQFAMAQAQAQGKRL